jgi:arginase
MRQFTFIGAPASSIQTGNGVASAPETLRDLGLAAALNAEDAGDMDCAFGLLDKCGPGELRAQAGIVEASAVMRRRIAHLVGNGAVPFVAGGCCAVLPGVLAGTRDGVGRNNPMGLVYLDGHCDLYDRESSPSGEAADMALATVLGRGPKPWVDALGAGALIRPENAAILGFRDREDAEFENSLMPEDFGPGIAIYDADSLRGDGAKPIAANVTSKLSQIPGQFWLHFDVDVLDEEFFPATDYLLPNGLDWEDVGLLLRVFIASPALAGISLACYNPSKDTGASCGLRLVDLFQAICKQ